MSIKKPCWKNGLSRRYDFIICASQNACGKDEKINLWFSQSLCRKTTSRFWKLTKPTWNTASENGHNPSKPPPAETHAKNLEVDFSDSTKPTWTYASRESATERKRRELKNLLAEKIWNQNANLKNATVEAGIYFYDLKTVAAKNGFAFYLQLKTKLVLQRWFCICSWVA